MGDRADYISIRFQNTPLYLIPVAKDKEAVPNGWKITQRLPPMRPKGSTGEFIDKAAEVTSNSLHTLIVTNIVISFLLSLSLKPIFDLINTL